MNTISRGIRNAFRNQIRTISIVVILGLSIGLSLAMLIAHQAVNQKITSVKSSVGNTITVTPAGYGQGFGSGGNPLTETELAKVQSLAHVVSVSQSLSDRLTTNTNTNLQSAVSLGSLGRRFEGAGSNSTGGGGGGSAFFGGGGSGTGATTTFTPPVTVVGTTSPTTLSSTGSSSSSSFTLKSGTVFSGSSSDDVALVGTTLATKNNLKVGSTFTAYNTTITVDGIFDGGSTFVNNQVILPLATEQKLSDQTGDVTSASVTVDSINNLSSTTTAIKNQLGTSTADVTDDVTRAQTEIQPLQDVSSISLYSLIGAVIAGGVIVLLTMIMIVRERRREIGIFKALGASNFKVMFQFMSEAVTLTLLGAIVGIILGVVAGNPITKLLVNNSSSTTATTPGAGGGFGGGRGGGGGGFGFIHNNVTNIHATIGYSIIIYGLLAAIVIALIGSAAVSFLIAKVRPAEVMRSE
jgi:putative ABC transport system permease protein